MTKFYLREQKDTPKKERVYFDGKQVDKYTVIETRFGEVNVAPENWIFTDSEGNKFGVANADIGNAYLTDEKITTDEEEKPEDS